MNTAYIHETTAEVNRQLAFFSVTQHELMHVAQMAAAARTFATNLHPANAPGMYSYMDGVAALRMTFMHKPGWEVSRSNGVEAVANRDLGALVMFQNVDRACLENEPCPASLKGDGVSKIVENPTAYLFPDMEAEARAAENQSAWFYCVSYHNNCISAELSLPRTIQNGSFGGFSQRIFVMQEQHSLSLDENISTHEEIPNLEIQVTKKE